LHTGYLAFPEGAIDGAGHDALRACQRRLRCVSSFLHERMRRLGAAAESKAIEAKQESLHRQQYDGRVKFSPVLLLGVLSGCHAPKALVDPELAAYMPAGSTALAGIDLDRLRTTPLFAKIPEPFRDGSYTLVGYNGKDLVTASRVGQQVRVSGAGVKGIPPELLRHATDAPVWMVARGSAALPLTGNLANLNRLLRQTEYTTVAARVGESVDVEIAGVCRSPELAQHLEENVRAIVSLMKLPLAVRRDGVTVKATGSVTVEAAGKLF
jgi:hypothetical protein